MHKKQRNIQEVEGNPIGSPAQNKGNQRDMNLSQLPIVLKRSLQDYEDSMRLKTDNKYFDFYEEINALTGIAPSTLRHYLTTTEQSLEYPPVNKLIQICLIIQDARPLEFIHDYVINVMEIN